MAHVKQAMILAAGKGTRMRPLTLKTPKPLLKVAGKPLIYWHIERLAKAGVADIVVNTGYLGDVLATNLQQAGFAKLGINLHLCNEGDNPLETAGAIKNALNVNALKNAPFILINGDVWATFPLERLANHQLDNHLAYLILTSNPSHNPQGDFILHNGKVLVDDGCDTLQSKDKYTFAGLSVICPKLVDDVVGVAPLAPVLKTAMATGQVMGELNNRYHWVDVGTPERLVQLEKWIASQTVVLM